ncbi:hypothetical protein QVD99_008044 [Batrachochytrium dendrobatidis]|nr:hypothetical protein QVD99_008044 [Batrachochytrium dendrobatidis]
MSVNQTNTSNLLRTINDPHAVIEELLLSSKSHSTPDSATESTSHSDHDLVRSHFAALIQSSTFLSMIPYLTLDNQGSLPNHSLVRLRCFIQDNSASFETYPSKCSVFHATTGEEKIMNLIYRDTVELPWEFPINNLSAIRSFSEKQPYFCFAVPAEAEWVKSHITPSTHETDLTQSLARVEITSQDSIAASSNPSDLDKMYHLAVCKDGAQAFQSLMKMKMGHADPTHATIVKTYGNEEFQLNEIIEVIGILDNAKLDAIEDKDMLNEMSLSSMLPCVHVILSEKLEGKLVNPLTRIISNPLPKFSEVAQALRQTAIDSLQGCLMGDALAAEYIFLQMFSRITNRAGGTFPVGYLPINLCNAPPAASCFAASLASALHLFVPHVHYLSMKLENLNTGLWIDADQARYNDQVDLGCATADLGLCAGALQLPNSTLLVVDESSLTDGTLVDRGVKNIKAIGNVIQNAEVSFGVGLGGSIQRPVDYRVLVISEGKSMFKELCTIPIQTDPNGSYYTPALTQDQLHLLRIWIEETKHGEPDFEPSMDERIQKEFTESQQTARINNLPVDDGSMLLQRLNLAQLLCRSYGLGQMNDECWKQAGKLETARLARCASFTTRKTSTAK